MRQPSNSQHKKPGSPFPPKSMLETHFWQFSTLREGGGVVLKVFVHDCIIKFKSSRSVIQKFIVKNFLMTSSPSFWDVCCTSRYSPFRIYTLLLIFFLHFQISPLSQLSAYLSIKLLSTFWAFAAPLDLSLSVRVITFCEHFKCEKYEFSNALSVVFSSSAFDFRLLFRSFSSSDGNQWNC